MEIKEDNLSRVCRMAFIVVTIGKILKCWPFVRLHFQCLGQEECPPI